MRIVLSSALSSLSFNILPEHSITLALPALIIRTSASLPTRHMAIKLSPLNKEKTLRVDGKLED